MSAVAAVLRALALLVGLWGLLAGVAWATGSLLPIRPVWLARDAAAPREAPPPAPTRDVAPAEAPPPDDADAPGDGDDAQAAAAPAPPDEGATDDGATDDGRAAAPAPPAAPRLTGPPRPTTFVCEGDVADPTVSVVDVVGDPRPELAVACGDTTFLLALRGKPLRPERVATFEARPTAAGVQSSHGGAPVVADVTGDALPDLVLPIWRADVRGAVRGGGLWVVPRDVSGGFGAPLALADVPVVAVEALVERVGATAFLAALHRASALARRPSDVRVFAGGPSPEKTATLRTGVGAVDLAAADLDGDGTQDLAALAGEDPQLDVFRGQGGGRFSKLFSLAVTGGRELVALDADGDGRRDLLVLAEGLAALLMPDAARGQTSPALRELVGAADLPPGLDRLHAQDLDGDGTDDLVGRAGTELVGLPRGGPYAFEAPRPVLPRGFVPSGGAVASFAVGDFAIDGEPDLALVFRRGADAAWELVLVDDVRAGDSGRPADEPERLADAPLSLRVELTAGP